MPKSRHTVRYDRLLQTLKAARKEAGLTQTQVAKQFRSHASFVSKCESGERRIDAVDLADFCRVLVKRLRELVRVRPRFGYPRMAVLLEREGWHVNPKRIYRLGCKKELKLPKGR